MPINAHDASRGLVMNSMTSEPTTVMLLRSATDMLLPTTPRISSTSAVNRDTSSPLRLRSWKPASSPIRCAYSRSRISATTRSPSSEMKKKRVAVLSARTSATTNSSRKALSISLPLPLRKPSSIMVLIANGKLSDVAEDTISASSHATKST